MKSHCISSMVTLVSSLKNVPLPEQWQAHMFINNKKQDNPAEVVKVGTVVVIELNTEK